MKAYQDYKPSGIEWLGEVPSHWQAVKFGHIFTENKIKNKGMIENNLLSLSYGNIIQKNIENAKGLVPENFETYQIVNPDDIIFRFTDLQNDKKSLRSAISKYRGIITSAYVSVKLKKDGNADFFNYLFRAYDLMKVFYSMGDGMRQSLKMDELNRLVLFIPPLAEQQKIAQFLDTKTAQIDALIAEQNRLIELLTEQRKAVISHAVTKGLNPNTPMKNSGVEWLGEVPSHWTIAPLKSVITFWRNGKWGNDPHNNSPDNIICLRVADFNRATGFIDDKKLTLRNFSDDKIDDCLLEIGDILIERSGGGEKQLVGDTALFDLPIKAVCSNFISLLKINKNLILPQFLKFQFDNMYYQKVNRLCIKQTSGIQNLDLKVYLQNNITYPPLAEQQKIAQFLDIKTAQIDALIAEQKALIERLKEYRTALISAAVTGKIDVQSA